jgi:hypothetical protein
MPCVSTEQRASRNDFLPNQFFLSFIGCRIGENHWILRTSSCEGFWLGSFLSCSMQIGRERTSSQATSGLSPRPTLS